MSSFRSQKYMDWVKTLPSYIDQDDSQDAHHIHGCLGLGGSTKAHDVFTIPMTRRQHTLSHSIGSEAYFKQKSGTQAEAVLLTLDKAIRDGVITITVNV